MVDRIESEYEGRVDFKVYATVNSDQAAGQFASQQGVSAIPTMVVVGADGTEIERHIGGIDDAGLRQLLDSALGD